METIKVAQRVRVTDYTSTTNTTQLNKREHKMKLKLKTSQMEQVTVTHLDKVHYELKSELSANDIEPHLDFEGMSEVIRSIIAIEVVMRDLMFEDAYYIWKSENGVEL